MPQVSAKTILSTMKNGAFWFGSDYTMNLYRGCCHGCIYCDSRSECYHVDNFDCVRMKKDAILLLGKELRKKRKKGIIGIGAMSDSYNPYEAHVKLTREALKLIDYYGFGVSLETKSDLILRDLDLFLKIASKNNVIIKMSITCADDELSRKIEPHVCVSSKRFMAMKQMSDAGLFCGVLMMPLLPFINDDQENIEAIVKKAYEANAKFVYSMLGVTLRDRQREYFYEQLDTLFPGLSFQYRQVYNNRYVCEISEVEKKQRCFEQACKKYGLLYKMEDIIKAYQTHKAVEQLQLF
ncbi:MAG: radical SAM protein [Erysipelotrichia bacterium]|nr:radical SAM protein [Erysipelotrichia bacterium]NCC54605.1 radical SAM protein [Erysipelotrichia bacterium]